MGLVRIALDLDEAYSHSVGPDFRGWAKSRGPDLGVHIRRETQHAQVKLEITLLCPKIRGAVLQLKKKSTAWAQGVENYAVVSGNNKRSKMQVKREEHKQAAAKTELYIHSLQLPSICACLKTVPVGCPCRDSHALLVMHNPVAPGAPPIEKVPCCRC